MKKVFASLSIVFATAFLVQSAPVTIELPIETALYKPAADADLANAQCLTCHSAEYVSSQPPLSRAFWKGSVEKMMTKYGAPVPADQIEALVNYLASNYGQGATNAPAASSPASDAPLATTGDAKLLMQKSGCFNCHTVDKKFLGPSFKEVAAKYKGIPDASAKVTRQITHGGSGLWGPFPMPPFKQFSEADVRILTAWILAQE